MTGVLPNVGVIIDQPGVYDMDEVVYFSDPVPAGSLSASGAKLLLPPSCPALFRHAADNPPKTKRAFDLGHAAHKHVLGVGAELVAVQADNWLTKKAKETAAEARAEGKIPLLAREVAQVEAMAAAIRRNPLAAALLNPDRGKPEQSIFWRDETADIWCRARLDWLPTSGNGRLIVADYKTAVSAEPGHLRRAMFNFGYHIQHFWYLDAIRTLGLADDPAFVFIVQEKTPPYLVTVVQFDTESERLGEMRSRLARSIFADCVESQFWPGYSTEIEQVSPPVWLARQYEADEW